VLLLVTPSVVFGQRAATVSASAKAGANSTESRSAGLAAELTQLLTEKKLDSIATPDPAGDQYVGALYIPGAQLLVIRAKYPSKDRMSYLLYNKMYRDAYVDLNSASDPTTRVFITDLGANGLQFKREKDQPFDMVDLGGKAMAFDGKWGGKEAPSRDEYARTYQTSDEQYSLMLQALIEALKKSS
jgi:hypothetical protein